MRSNKPVNKRVQCGLLVLLLIFPLIIVLCALDLQSDYKIYKKTDKKLNIKILKSNNHANGIILPVVDSSAEEKGINIKSADKNNNKFYIPVVKKDEFSKEQANALKID